MNSITRTRITPQRIIPVTRVFNPCFQFKSSVENPCHEKHEQSEVSK